MHVRVFNERHKVDRKHLDMKPFQQFALVGNGRLEKVDPLTKKSDTHAPTKSIGGVQEH